MASQTKTDDGFSTRPRPDQMPVKFEVRRCPPRGFQGAIILSHNVLGRDLHYVGNQSRVCGEEECPYCTPENVPRWYGYVFTTDRDLSCVVIQEFTSGAMQPVDAYFREHRTLIGADLTMWRKGETPAGQCYCKLRPSRINKETLPKTPSLKKILCRMWGIEATGTNVENPKAKIKLLKDLDRKEREAG